MPQNHSSYAGYYAGDGKICKIVFDMDKNTAILNTLKNGALQDGEGKRCP